MEPVEIAFNAIQLGVGKTIDTVVRLKNRLRDLSVINVDLSPVTASLTDLLVVGRRRAFDFVAGINKAGFALEKFLKGPEGDEKAVEAVLTELRAKAKQLERSLQTLGFSDAAGSVRVLEKEIERMGKANHVRSFVETRDCWHPSSSTRIHVGNLIIIPHLG